MRSDEVFDELRRDVAVNGRRKFTVRVSPPAIGRRELCALRVLDVAYFDRAMRAVVLAGRAVVIFAGLHGKNRAVCAFDLWCYGFHCVRELKFRSRTNALQGTGFARL